MSVMASLSNILGPRYAGSRKSLLIRNCTTPVISWSGEVQFLHISTPIWQTLNPRTTRLDTYSIYTFN
jgi:hypothetical protein